MEVTPVTIVNVGYRSTNYWVVSAGASRLLVDIGWPGTLGTLKANLKKMDIPIGEIHYALATHYHIDRAGLAEELKREGVRIKYLCCSILSEGASGNAYLSTCYS
jgi:glyoxylase-like metal-dependent hydrolase (beta-lactamase superfamily II)